MFNVIYLIKKKLIVLKESKFQCLKLSLLFIFHNKQFNTFVPDERNRSVSGVLLERRQEPSRLVLRALPEKPPAHMGQTRRLSPLARQGR